MGQSKKFRPFTGGQEPSFRLQKATLPLVLGQLKWAARQKVNREFDELAANFGAAIEERFPVYEERDDSRLVVSRNGMKKEASEEKVYHWSSVDGLWNVVLARRYFSLFCLNNAEYSFPDFEERLQFLMEQLQLRLGIGVFEAVAFRSVNIYPVVEYGRELGNMFNPSLLGLSQFLPEADVTLSAVQNRAIYRVDEIQFNVQSSRFDRGVMVDPLMPKVPAESWILDLDSSAPVNHETDVCELIGKMSAVNYDFFVAALTTEGRSRLGGENA